MFIKVPSLKFNKHSKILFGLDIIPLWETLSLIDWIVHSCPNQQIKREEFRKDKKINFYTEPQSFWLQALYSITN